MDKIEKIRAEIERLISMNKTRNGFPAGMMCAIRIEAYENLLSFLSNLSEEPDKSLEEAAEDFVWEVMEEDYDGPSELSKKLRPSSKISDYYDALAEFFKAGAKWGAEHAKK